MSIDNIFFLPELKPASHKDSSFFVCERHQAPRKDKATGLPLIYGNGCKRHDNCFTCPFPPDKCYYHSAKGQTKRR